MIKPEISLKTVSSALADFLKGRFPDAHIYDNPNQQDTERPAWFIEFMPNSSVKKQIDGRYLRKLYIDLAYLTDYNLPDLFDIYKNAAEVLDEHLELLPYESDGESYLLRTYDRKWDVDLSALHYKLRLDLRVTRTKPESAKMLEIERLTERVIEKE
jgi:hypothetical protein